MLALFDVLGFKAQLKQRGLASLYEIYRSLIKHVQPIAGRAVHASIPDRDGKLSVCLSTLVVEQAYFSDTILIWTDYGHYLFDGFCELCSDLVCESIRIGLPLRGAITIGEAILDSSTRVFIGDPIVQAHLLESQQKWIGASLCAFETRCHVDASHIMPYTKQFKEGPTGKGPQYALDWPRRWRTVGSGDLAAEIARLDTDPNAHDYYARTLEFVQHSEQNQEWFKAETSA